MTDDEWRAFLTEPARTGKLATVRADGRPHVAPAHAARSRFAFARAISNAATDLSAARDDKERWLPPLSKSGDAAVSGYGCQLLEPPGRGLSPAANRPRFDATTSISAFVPSAPQRAVSRPRCRKRPLLS